MKSRFVDHEKVINKFCCCSMCLQRHVDKVSGINMFDMPFPINIFLELSTRELARAGTSRTSCLR